MEDKQLRNIAQLLVNDAIDKAIDKIKAETNEIDEGLDQRVEGIVGLTIARSVNAIRDGQTSPTDDKMEGITGHNNTLVTSKPEVATDTTGNDKPTGLKKAHVTTTHAQTSKGSPKKNVLERLLDRILKRDKKEVKESNTATAGGSTNTSVGGKKKSSSEAHNKKDWIRRNLLCCLSDRLLQLSLYLNKYSKRTKS